MFYVKWGFWGIFWTVLVAFLHYTLPDHDIVRVNDTYERRIEPGDNALFWSNADTGDNTRSTGRDVFFIQAFRNDDKPMIYRNEDTGWGWPPYFKFDASNLQAQASDAVSSGSDGNARWVKILHYGWRNEFLSIYPNAVSVTPVEGPDVRIIPWIKIVILALLGGLFWAIRARWKKFWQRREEWAADEWNDGTA
ncbi:MAG: DUF1523 family protein [Roseovarius sp.]